MLYKTCPYLSFLLNIYDRPLYCFSSSSLFQSSCFVLWSLDGIPANPSQNEWYSLIKFGDRVAKILFLFWHDGHLNIKGILCTHMARSLQPSWFQENQKCSSICYCYR